MTLSGTGSSDGLVREAQRSLALAVLALAAGVPSWNDIPRLVPCPCRGSRVFFPCSTPICLPSFVLPPTGSPDGSGLHSPHLTPKPLFPSTRLQGETVRAPGAAPVSLFFSFSHLALPCDCFPPAVAVSTIRMAGCASRLHELDAILIADWDSELQYPRTPLECEEPCHEMSLSLKGRVAF